MEDITKTQGRTILFVSHNMGAIQSLCSKCVLLDHGSIVMVGKTSEVINLYTAPKEKASTVTLDSRGKEVNVEKIWLENELGKKIATAEMGDDIFLNVEYFIEKEIPSMDISALVSKGRSIFVSVFRYRYK